MIHAEQKMLTLHDSKIRNQAVATHTPIARQRTWQNRMQMLCKALLSAVQVTGALQQEAWRDFQP